MRTLFRSLMTDPHWWDRVDWTIVVQHAIIILAAVAAAFSARKKPDG